MPGYIVPTEQLGLTVTEEATGAIQSIEMAGIEAPQEISGIDAVKQKTGADSSGYEAWWLWGDADPIEWGDGQEISL